MSENQATVWILGDQLLVNHPALRAAEVEHGRAAVQVLMIESRQRSRRLPYHRKKLVLLFSAMRHYASRLEEAGYQVDYRKTDTFSEGLKRHVRGTFAGADLLHGGQRLRRPTFSRDQAGECGRRPGDRAPQHPVLDGTA